MKSKNDFFTSFRSPTNSIHQDKLPLELGVTTLITVFFKRFLSVLIAAIPTVVVIILVFLVGRGFSQYISILILVPLGTVFLLFTIFFFRHKTTSFDKHLKRLFDISICLISLPSMVLLYVLVAFLIKLDSKGPVLTYQKRIGKDGREINLFRFRTREFDYVNLNSQKKSTESLKLTRFGKFLRRTNIDELPQFINVLRGEMSLVGPRPLLPSELEKFDNEYIEDVESVIPGLTGLWQISSYFDTTDDSRIYWDRFYVRNWSLWLDLKIILRTVTVALVRTGAY